MPAPVVRAKLVGSPEDQGLVQLDDFLAFCGGLKKCLRVSEEAVAGERSRLRYRIRNLGTGSAEIDVEAIAPDGDGALCAETIGLFRSTVRSLQTRQPLDPRIRFRDLDAFRELTRPLRRQVAQVWVDASPVTPAIDEAIDEILERSLTSHGSVSGLLERVNLHNKREFFIYPPIPDRNVKCLFAHDQFDDVRMALGRQVTVYGELSYEPGQVLPYKARVARIERHPPDEELPSLSSLRGIAPDCTGELDSVEFVRRLRDE